MTGQTIGLLLVMIIYLILMVGIGVLYSKKNNDVSDFYLGGRKLGPIVTAMSAEASDMSKTASRPILKNILLISSLVPCI